MIAITTGHLEPCPHCGAGSLAPCTAGPGKLLPYAHVERLRA